MNSKLVFHILGMILRVEALLSLALFPVPATGRISFWRRPSPWRWGRR